MINHWWAALLAAALAGTAACAPPKEIAGPAETQAIGKYPAMDASFVTTTRREGARQPFLLLRPPRPVASVILFTGGDGVVGIGPQGIKRGGNFLVHARQLFARQDLLVAIVDPPSDRDNLDGFRTSHAHALDIKGVIAYLRAESPGPVWLVGTSYGTVSAVKVADWLADDGGPDGLVLTSSLFLPGRIGDTVRDADPARVRVPVLVVHHRNDRCRYTPFSEAGPFVRRLAQARPVELMAFEGGGPVKGGVCEPLDYHGFPGIREQVVEAIANWIKTHPPR